MKSSNPCLAFIVGMPRAGTTYLSKVLNSHRDIVSVGESLYWGRNFVVPDGGGGYNASQVESLKCRLSSWNWGPELGIASAVFKEKLELEFAGINLPCTPDQPFNALAKVFCDLNNKLWFIEKTPHHINWIDRIHRYYPNAKFIIARRDPYSFMLSYKFQGQQSSKEVREVFRKLYHPISCAVVWRKNYRSIQRALCKYPNQTFLFEQSELSDERKLRLLESFLGLDCGSLKVLPRDNSSFESEITKPTLTKVDVFWMNVVAVKEIRHSHFSGRLVRPNPVFVLWSLITFPFKALLGVYLIAKNSQSSVLSYLCSYLKR